MPTASAHLPAYQLERHRESARAKVKALADRIRQGDRSTCPSTIANTFMMLNHLDRFEFCRRISWSVPDTSSLKTAAEFLEGETCVDYGAGLGLWSLLLQREGIDIVPVDVPRNSKPGSLHCEEDAEEFTPVLRVKDPLSWVDQHSFSVVFVSWPRYECPETAKFISGVNPRKLVFIGEDRGGCTGDDSLFDLMQSHFEEVGTFSVPQWFGIHDFGRRMKSRQI